MSRFDRRSTALDVIRQVDLKGKTVVVTGACSGTGAEIARAMAAAGAELIMPARNIEAASAMADTLITDTGNAKIRIYQLDLADFDSIRRFADNLFYDYSRVDILINNAGVLAVPFQLCPQGFELHFSVNHLGHFLLTSVLSKALLASPAPRVVSVSAAAHALSPSSSTTFTSLSALTTNGLLTLNPRLPTFYLPWRWTGGWQLMVDLQSR